MICVNDKSTCCGCTACASICPVQAIKMAADKCGFMYPIIDKDKCTKCGLCEEVCVYQAEAEGTGKKCGPAAYGVRYRDEEVVRSCRSGGMFSALAKNMINNGGVVYGAAFSDRLSVVHKRSETQEEIVAFRGSKYVQSDLGDSYALVKADLERGMPVLFSGTPCQVAGLRGFLKDADTEKLVLCDLICHGTPSPLIWRDYLAWTEKKSDSLSSHSF